MPGALGRGETALTAGGRTANDRKEMLEAPHINSRTYHSSRALEMRLATVAAVVGLLVLPVVRLTDVDYYLRTRNRKL